MEHYRKGRNEEEELRKDNIPMKDLPLQYGWQEVTGSTRVRADVGALCKLIKEEGALVIGGSGTNTEKVVTLAEIIKRRIKNVRQEIKIGEKVVREFWDPKTEELDPLVVTRHVPTVHILLEINKGEVSKSLDLMDVLWGEESKPGSGGKRKRPRKNGRKKEEHLVENLSKVNIT